MKTWPIYVKYQNELAYGTSVPLTSDVQTEQASITRTHLQRLQAERSLVASLVIGPGGPDEVRALHDVMPKPLYALTAHEPEARAVTSAFPDVVSTFGDMHEMPFASGSFDLVYASNVLEHAIAPYAALMQIRRVLREGGIALLVLPTFEGAEGGRGPFHLHCLDSQVWMELLRKCGLSVVDVEYVPGGSGEGGYHHFRCAATAPPRPHDIVLNELVTYHGTH